MGLINQGGCIEKKVSAEDFNIENCPYYTTFASEKMLEKTQCEI